MYIMQPPQDCRLNVIRRLLTFAAQFLPYSWAHFLFLIGALLLLVSSSLSWSPIVFQSSDVYRWLPEPEFHSAFFRELYTQAQEPLVWSWNLALLFPRLLILLAGVAALVLCFAASEKNQKRAWRWVWVLTATGLVLVWLRLLLEAVRIGSVLVDRIEKARGFLAETPQLMIDLGPGFHCCVLGLFLTAAGVFLFRRRHVKLPVRFRRTLLTGPVERMPSDSDIRFFVYLVIGLTGLLTFAGKAYFLWLMLRPSQDWTQRPWPLTLELLLVTSVPVLCALLVTQNHGSPRLPGLLRLGPPRYYALAALLPLLVRVLAQPVAYLLQTVRWENATIIFVHRSLGSIQFVPHWSLVALLPLAYLEEAAWRGYLQPRFTLQVGLRRGVFLVGLVWGLWHISVDVGFTMNHQAAALHVITRMAWSVAYSVVLGWMILRTTSVATVTLMHATINFLNSSLVLPFAGSFTGYIEIAVWGLIGYALFKYFPPPDTHTFSGLTANEQLRQGSVSGAG